MPVLKHAKKKLRQDKKRTLQNRKMKDLYKKLVKKARETKTTKAIDAAVSSVDKAAKNHLIHPNKASRLKSSLTKEAPKRAVKPAVAKKAATTKASVKKSPAKKVASTKGGSSSGRKKTTTKKS